MPGEFEVMTVPPVGDGNPNTASALEELALGRPDLDVHRHDLSVTAFAARLFHERMTASPDKAAEYIGDSEKRTDLISMMYAHGSSLEFAARALFHRRSEGAAWTVVQEHALLGASKIMLRALGIDEIRLATPDVMPKDSGLEAVRKHAPNSTIYVWNSDAQRELDARGFRTALTAPYLSSYRQGNGHEGHQIVAKTSGSGIPPTWRSGLRETLGQVDSDWVFHTPDTKYTKNGGVEKKKGSRHLFFDDVGTGTEVIIGYPSELTGMVAGRNESGLPTWMATLPPRGAHEMGNLRFAVKHGIVLGELALNSRPSIDDGSLRRITLEDLPSVLESISGQQPTWEKGQGIVGTTTFWDVARPLSS